MSFNDLFHQTYLTLFKLAFPPKIIINNVLMWKQIINIKVDPNQQNTKSNFAVEQNEQTQTTTKKNENKRWLVWSENKRTLTTRTTRTTTKTNEHKQQQQKQKWKQALVGLKRKPFWS